MKFHYPYTPTKFILAGFSLYLCTPLAFSALDTFMTLYENNEMGWRYYSALIGLIIIGSFFLIGLTLFIVQLRGFLKTHWKTDNSFLELLISDLQRIVDQKKLDRLRS